MENGGVIITDFVNLKKEKKLAGMCPASPALWAGSFTRNWKGATPGQRGGNGKT
jgi:hypothetical protein